MIQYPLSTSIQQFQRLENVSSDLMNLFYTTTTENLNAYFPISPCIMSGINNISNNYGQIGTSNVFEFAAGAVRFPNQITVIPGSIIEEFTWAPYAGASITLNGITDGTVYYCVAKLTQIANDSYKVTNTMTILDTAVTASGLNDQNVALFAITSDTGVYTVFLDSNCAYNYDANNNIQSDFNRNNNLGTVTTHTISLADAFSLIYNDGISIAYTLPNYVTLPVGATFCIKNQLGTISNGITRIRMTSAYSNAYYKCEVGNNGWIIDGQPIATYSHWATQQYVADYVADYVAVNGYFSQLFEFNGDWICPNDVYKIYVTLIGGGGGGAGGGVGGGGGGGGGGAGYLIFKRYVLVTPGTSYSITIGLGGIVSTGAGNNGSPTIAFGLTAVGGFGGSTNGQGGFGGSTGANSSNGIGGGGGSLWIAGGGRGGTGNGYPAESEGGGGGGAGAVGALGGPGGNGLVLIEY